MARILEVVCEGIRRSKYFFFQKQNSTFFQAYYSLEKRDLMLMGVIIKRILVKVIFF